MQMEIRSQDHLNLALIMALAIIKLPTVLNMGDLGVQRALKVAHDEQPSQKVQAIQRYSLDKQQIYKIERVSGAPGMRPNLIKFVYYQFLSEVPFWKNGPESGPILFNVSSRKGNEWPLLDHY